VFLAGLRYASVADLISPERCFKIICGLVTAAVPRVDDLFQRRLSAIIFLDKTRAVDGHYGSCDSGITQPRFDSKSCQC